MIDPSSTEEHHSWSYFWPIWGATILLLSIGCVAGDQNVSVGEIGVCGASSEQWTEGRGKTGFLGFYHAVNSTSSFDVSEEASYYDFDPFLIEQSFGSYYVSHWATGEPARIVDVSSSAPQVVAIDTVYADQGLFDVEAVGTGYAEIRVETDAGVADRIDLFVTDLARVDFNHCCSSGPSAYYLTDSEIEIPVTYYDSYGETPIGFGRFPFRVSDEENLTWLSRPDPADIHLRTGKRAGNVTLTPTVAGEALTLELISPSEVDGISVHLEPDRYTSGLWVVGGVLHRNQTPLCAGKYPMRLESLTPSVCQLVNSADQLVSRMQIAGDETALLEERSSGDCKLMVQLLDDNGDVVIEQEASESFGRSTSSGGSSRDWDD